MTGVPDSHMQILSIIRQIPRGKVCTYGRIAMLAGLPGRARLVGKVLRYSPLANGVPWHRVVNASGCISLRSGESPVRQKSLLEGEGIRFNLAHRVDLNQYLWESRHASKRRGK
ncbi:MAG: MGMT family protein [Planctomycetes bacterium]|nr:MGMT family protein [Planctomycetota bacterium]